jgi:very-short-patch-repair endonuclease
VASTKMLAIEALGYEIASLLLPPPVSEHLFAKSIKRRWRFDLAWPALLLAVEVDGGTWSGGRHVRGRGYEGDCEKLNTATLMGWRVLRFTSDMVNRGEAIGAILAAFEQSQAA